MKGIDLFCASQAATSICLSMEELVSSSSSSSVIQLGGNNISCGRLIDRYNPIIRESRRTGGSGRIEPQPPYSSGSKRIGGSCHNGQLLPCSSDSRRIIGGSGRFNGPLPHSSSDSRRHMGGSGHSEPLPPVSSPQLPISSKSKNNDKKCTSSKPSKETKKKRSISSWSCTKPSEFITPPSSTRYLLNEKDLLDVLSNDNNDQVLKSVPNSSSSLVNSKSCKNVKVAADHESCNPSKPPSSTSSGDQVVVVLQVSLHCRACEKKMRKHLSRMEGVASFNIDFAAKKVTVIGDVTPLGVLASISKVTNAQLWPPTVTSSVPSVNKPNNLIEMSHEKLENISQNSLAIIQLL